MFRLSFHFSTKKFLFWDLLHALNRATLWLDVVLYNGPSLGVNTNLLQLSKQRKTHDNVYITYTKSHIYHQNSVHNMSVREVAASWLDDSITLTTTQLHLTTLRGFPSLSILQRPTHSPSSSLSSTYSGSRYIARVYCCLEYTCSNKIIIAYYSEFLA